MDIFRGAGHEQSNSRRGVGGVILASLRSGALGNLPAVHECRSSSALGREWGVDETSAKLVGGKRIEIPCARIEYAGTVIDMYRHPLLLIPYSVMQWGKEYEYAGDHYSIVPYLERHPCAVELYSIYTTALAHFRRRNG